MHHRWDKIGVSESQYTWDFNKGRDKEQFHKGQRVRIAVDVISTFWATSASEWVWEFLESGIVSEKQPWPEAYDLWAERMKGQTSSAIAGFR